MSSVPKTVRMPEEVLEPIEDECRRTGRDFSAVVNERLLESNKMRRIPGIIFVDSPSGGRVARVAGTGIEVFEIVQAHRSVENCWPRLRESVSWLSDTQLRTALAYAEAYAEEIEERIRRDEQRTPETVWQRYPFMSLGRAERFFQDDAPHAGVLVVPYTIPTDRFRQVAAAIAQYDREHPDGISTYGFDYVPQPRD